MSSSLSIVVLSAEGPKAGAFFFRQLLLQCRKVAPIAKLVTIVPLEEARAAAQAGNITHDYKSKDIWDTEIGEGGETLERKQREGEVMWGK